MFGRFFVGFCCCLFVWGFFNEEWILKINSMWGLGIAGAVFSCLEGFFNVLLPILTLAEAFNVLLVDRWIPQTDLIAFILWNEAFFFSTHTTACFKLCRSKGNDTGWVREEFDPPWNVAVSFFFLFVANVKSCLVCCCYSKCSVIGVFIILCLALTLPL